MPTTASSRSWRTSSSRPGARGAFVPDLPTQWVVALIDGQLWAAGGAVANGIVGLVQAQELIWHSIMTGISTMTGGSTDAEIATDAGTSTDAARAPADVE